MKHVETRKIGWIRFLRAQAVAVVLCCIFIPRLFGASIDSAEIVNNYHQANEMFHSANKLAATRPDEAKDLYRKAVIRYERIINEGKIQNGKLYYNIGNIYFRLNDLGRAILNYRRAQQYMPNDVNLQHNLNYARTFRKDRIEEKQQTRILKTLFFWHYDIPTRIRVVIFGCGYGLLWIFAAARLFARKSFLSVCLVASITLSVIFAGSLFAEFNYLRTVKPGVVISDNVIARKGNSETYEPSFKEPLHTGTEFWLVEKRNKWCYIELPDERRCWIPSKDVELVRSKM